ncbi:type II CRISPR RNA-guided endonuclease Cas9 [Aquibacillus sp. 3ASR75-11]|uniref:CRISPR-associated endonuclease Cas9 n=1 Tax=Terrihalobacillus insolitus TaxID=2950438 RepID=A0A9X3WU82_9BACI|nr:type II CRISPR RNA-guided endonuclease Cas9 [Terrihalobacillus insolitus]MDC3424713.1 type II CRISPR RNA-guided endonuclease Cas9 [Terrihalobacillus insolitus]
MKDLDYRIGLDIGTNSVGWGIIELERNGNNNYKTVGIIDSNVRMFDKAEIPKTGASLAEPRRLARSSRRRLHRHSDRKREIRKLLVQFDVLNEMELEQLYPLKRRSIDIWDIRLEGLDRLLSRHEWARLLIHLAQKRGFKSNRKSEEKEAETGQVISSVRQNKDRLANYRTVGEMWMSDPEFTKYGRRRNTRNEYAFNVSRSDLEQEIVTLFEMQRGFQSPHAMEDLQSAYLKIWNHQLPFASGNSILKKVGNCSLEENEQRIPKASYTFQYYMALDKINRVRIGPDIQPLSGEQRAILLKKLFDRNDLTKRKTAPEVKYSDIRKWLDLDENLKFNDLTYDPKEKLSKNEKLTFVNMNFYYEIKRIIDIYTKETGELYSVIDFDVIGFALTVYKTDKDIYQYLKNSKNLAKKVFDDALIEMLLPLSYSKFGHLSFKAINNLLPYMENGLSFKKAADEYGYDTTGLKKAKREALLPPIPDDIANPVVKRALTQSRKIVNSIIKKYGPPVSIHIELARELSKTHEERNKIIKKQKVNYERNTGAIKVLKDGGILQPTGYDIVRYKLWTEQEQKCAYSLKPIPAEEFFNELKKERNNAPNLDVDHILPYSQSFMDSYQNKVLVYSDENRKKGNKIPYEYFGHDLNKWEAFQDYVNNTNFSKVKKQYLLKKEFSTHEEELVKERHLNDTRYISRFFKNFVEKKLVTKDPNFKKRVVTVSGRVTSHLRSRWGLEKHRDKTHLHHALDAIVVACTDDSTIQQVTNYHKMKENNAKVKKYPFPQPWKNFRDELIAHLAEVPKPKEIHKALENNLPLPRYMLVSRVASRSVTGAAHKDTILMDGGIDKKSGKAIIVKRVPLKDIKFDKDGDFAMVNKETDPATYHVIKERYLSHGGNKNEAFEEPLYKPSNKGKGNPIRRVKVEVEKRSHVRKVNGGVAQNGDLVRIDLFVKDGNYYMVPVYVMDTSLPELPNKVVTVGKGYELWKELDDTYVFQFSLHPYDLVRMVMGEKDRFLYFSTIDIDKNRIIFKEPNEPHEPSDRRYSIRKIDKMEKYQVGILGDLSLVKRESRQTFNNRKDKKEKEYSR